MLRVAVPNKGALAAPAAEMLAEAGYRKRYDQRDLTVLDPANDVEFFFLRPEGHPDLRRAPVSWTSGITGRDQALESGAPVAERLPLGLRRLDVPLRGPGRHRLEGDGPGGQAPGHVLPEAGEAGPGRAGHRRDGHQARRRGRDLACSWAWPTRSPTSSTRAAPCANTTWSSSATRSASRRRCWCTASSAPDTAGEGTAGGPAAGRRVRAAVHDAGLRLPEVPPGRGHQVTPGLESPTVAPLASPGLGGGPRDGPEARRPTLSWTAWRAIGARAVLASDIRSCRL